MFTYAAHLVRILHLHRSVQRVCIEVENENGICLLAPHANRFISEGGEKMLIVVVLEMR